MAGVEPERIRRLVEKGSTDGRYVLYWMQAAQRAEHNPALEYAASRANEHRVPLVVLAVVIPDYPEASARQFAFMLGGLGRALRAVERRGMRPCVRVGEPVDEVVGLAGDAVEVVLDRGYLRHQRRWYDELTSRVDRPLVQVEGEVVVPTEVASDRQEHSARTFRPRVTEHRDRFLVDLDTVAVDDHTTPQHTSSSVDIDRLDDVDHVRSLLTEWGLDGGPEPVDTFVPGTDGARARFDAMLDSAATHGYDEMRNRFTVATGTSGLSPYLHFGQISPVAAARRAQQALGADDAEPFLEELVVRRELAVNFVLHERDYDSYTSLPEWARTSLADHRDDERDDVYTSSELEAAATHDEVWNAIMTAIARDGWVHNQLRMYWGKQIVRWTSTPEHAYRTLLELNNRWFLDGRDPNSFANVGWCFGLHDQGFAERAVTGKLRPFTTAALRRKDDLNAWLDGRS